MDARLLVRLETSMQTADSREAAPIACTLSAADMGPRVARIQAMTREHLRRHELLGSALRWRLWVTKHIFITKMMSKRP